MKRMNFVRNKVIFATTSYFVRRAFSTFQNHPSSLDIFLFVTYGFNETITSFFSDQRIFEESSLQFDHELDEKNENIDQSDVLLFITYFLTTR